MARINIEKDLWTRGEWLDLVVRTGSPDTALGALARVWFVAQRFWFPDQKLIPRDIWNRERLNQSVIDCGLAEEKEDGIYVRGAKEQFSWLFDASEKGKKGGTASAEKRKRGKNGSIAKTEGKKRSSTGQPQVEQGLTTGQAQVNPSQASLLSTPYSLLSSPAPTQISLLSSVSMNGQNANDRNPTGALIVRYKQLWKQAHNSKLDPPMTSKDTGILMRMNKAIGFERLMHLLSAYFAMPDGWAKKEKHKIEGFEARIKEIAAYAESGNFVTRRQAMQQDDHATTFDQLERVRKGEL